MGVKMKISKRALGYWINRWGDFNKHKECLDSKTTIKVKGGYKPNHITDFGRGYNQAMSDVFDRIGASGILDEVMNTKKRRVSKHRSKK